MHIVIDFQGAQTGSRLRGIGRYSTALVAAFAQLASHKHRITLLLNAAFGDTVDQIRREFGAVLAAPNITLWYPLAPSSARDDANSWRRAASEPLFEAAVAALNPDVLLVTSLFEGFDDNAISSVGFRRSNIPTAVILYDLIPLLNPDHYLAHPAVTAWYYDRVSNLRRADLLLGISNASCAEAVAALGISSGKVVNISSAVGPRFCPQALDGAMAGALRRRLGVSRPFVMYAGAIEKRKNVDGLIEGFARLPHGVREKHQLVLVYSTSDPTIEGGLRERAERGGLSEGDLVLLGQVSDEDLVALYRICTLFVLPSLHEGFGLPALEAMACGAPTIGSNTSSLPEVIGWDEALFDPESPTAISVAMERALVDTGFRDELRLRGLEQSKTFSWNTTARRTLEALESLVAQRPAGALSARIIEGRPRLAYVCLFGVEQRTAGRYAENILPYLATYYDIDLIVPEGTIIQDPWLRSAGRLRRVAWFESHARGYQRVVYHVSGCLELTQITELMERIPGVIVLEDFHLGSAMKRAESEGSPGVFVQSLLHSHGWSAVAAYFGDGTGSCGPDFYPCNLRFLQRALGVLVPWASYRILAGTWYGSKMAAEWSHVPQPCAPAIPLDRGRARSALRFRDDDLLVCAFGPMGSTCLNHRLIDAWNLSRLAGDPRCHLWFVGEEASGSYRDVIRMALSASRGNIHIASPLTQPYYDDWMAATDLCVQLNTAPRSADMGIVLDCMSHGLPVILNGDEALYDVGDCAASTLSKDWRVEELRSALEALSVDYSRRRALGGQAGKLVAERHHAPSCAAEFYRAVEESYRRAERGPLGFANAISTIGAPLDPADLFALGERMLRLWPLKSAGDRQLLVDISQLHQTDAKSGIQRVVRKVLEEVLKNPPDGYRIEAVYMASDGNYRYARRFVARQLAMGELPVDDSPVSVRNGDIFWGLDLHHNGISRSGPIFRTWRLQGLRIVFTVYDLIPIDLPETCDEGVPLYHTQWLETITASSNSLLCISQTVARRVAEWLSTNRYQGARTLNIGWAPLGADIVNNEREGAAVVLSEKQSQELQSISRYPSFLIVGTLEPRKAQAQALAAFEWLWSEGQQISLVIVGKKGWQSDELAARLSGHAERDRHLFWLQDIEDVVLDSLYSQCTCLLAASLDEGYGLPLIEAARHRLPILARDIGVFRELAGESATYFNGEAPYHIAEAVKAWLSAEMAQAVPNSGAIAWRGWREATEEMLAIIINDGWQIRWEAPKDQRDHKRLVASYIGSSPALKTQSGYRRGKQILSGGGEGFLLYGPYINMPAGDYVAEIFVTLGFGGLGDIVIDICAETGRSIFARKRVASADCLDQDVIIRVAFSLGEAIDGVEVRIQADDRADIAIDKLEIRRARHEPKKTEKRDPTEISVHSVSGIQERYWATHSLISSEVGYAAGRHLYTTGKAGVLLRSPELALPAGRYQLIIAGELGTASSASIEVASPKTAQPYAGCELLCMDKTSGTYIAEADLVLSQYTPDVTLSLLVRAESKVRVDGIMVREVYDRDERTRGRGEPATLEGSDDSRQPRASETR